MGLAATGVAARQIAREVGSDVPTVKKWTAARMK